jgi:hypothetical protein
MGLRLRLASIQPGSYILEITTSRPQGPLFGRRLLQASRYPVIPICFYTVSVCFRFADRKIPGVALCHRVFLVHGGLLIAMVTLRCNCSKHLSFKRHYTPQLLYILAPR